MVRELGRIRAHVSLAAVKAAFSFCNRQDAADGARVPASQIDKASGLWIVAWSVWVQVGYGLSSI
jgi:hypothetical protein